MRLGLKAAMLQRGLSQRQLARQSGIPENKLSEIVHGWTDPNPGERQRLAALLRQPEEILFNAGTSIELRSAS